MKLFLISQSQHDDYDTYDSAVVAAENEEDARNTNPGNGNQMTEEDWKHNFSLWCNSPEHVQVEYLGEAISDKKGVVCASFNAG